MKPSSGGVRVGDGSRLAPLGARREAVLRRRVHVALRAAVGGALLVFVASRADVTELSLPGGVTILGGLGAAVLLLAGALVLSAVRWWLVLGPGLVPLGWLVRLYFVGQFFSLFLPTSVGGDAVRVVALSRDGESTGRALSSVIIERLLGVAALMALLALGGLMTPSLVLAPLNRLTWAVGWREALVLAVAGAGTCGLLVLLSRRWVRVRQLLHDAQGVWDRFRATPLPSSAAVLAALVVQATYVLVWYVLAVNLQLGVPFRALVVFVPFVSLAAMLPVTIGGLGVREGVWVLLLQPLGVTAANAIGFSLLYYVANLVTGALGAGIYMARGAGKPSFGRA